MATCDRGHRYGLHLNYIPVLSPLDLYPPAHGACLMAATMEHVTWLLGPLGPLGPVPTQAPLLRNKTCPVN